jgi:hypothetical protein
VPTVIGPRSCSRISVASLDGRVDALGALGDHELVAADPADQGARAGDRAQPLGHLGEQLVAGRVAHRLVHVALTVDVEEQGGDDLGLGVDLDRLGERVGDPPAVGQAGEPIVVRVVPQALDQPGILDGGGRVRGDRLEHLGVGGAKTRVSPIRLITSRLPIVVCPDRSGTITASLILTARNSRGDLGCP